MADLVRQFGQIDIYLFDQLLRGRITPGMRVLDAGCGSGRNLVMRCGPGSRYSAPDADGNAIAEPVERMTFADGMADAVISSAVLHLARDDQQFDAMLRQSWRVLKPGGVFFCRLASTIGMEGGCSRAAAGGACCRTAADAIWLTKRC